MAKELEKCSKCLEPCEICALGDYCLLVGDRLETLSLVLVSCTSSDLARWQRKIGLLYREAHYFSVHLIPQGYKIRLLIRGRFPDNWVYRNLISTREFESKKFGVLAFEAKPERLRWRMLTEFPSGGVNVVRCGEDRAAAVVKEGNEWRCVYDSPSADLFYLFFEHHPDVDHRQVWSRLRHDRTLPVRDFFWLEENRSQLDPGRREIDMGSRFADHKNSLKATFAIAVVEMERQQESSLRRVINWRDQFLQQREVSGITIEVVPFEVLHDGPEYADLAADWNSEVAQKGHRNNVPAGFLRMSGVGKPGPSAIPDVVLPAKPAAVLGMPRTGKSVLAYHLLAQYVRSGYAVVFLNYKEASKKEGRAEPRNPELADFAAVMNQTQSIQVEAALPDRIGYSSSLGREVGSAHYTEMWSPGATARSVVDSVRARRQRKIVFCFDEVVNMAKHHHDIDPGALDVIENLTNESQSFDVYAMVIHQSLGDVNHYFKNFRAGAITFATSLNEVEDKEPFERLSRGVSFRGLDVSFAEAAVHEKNSGNFIVLRPLGSDEYRPLPLTLPAYNLPTESEKKSFVEGVKWGPVTWPERT